MIQDMFSSFYRFLNPKYKVKPATDKLDMMLADDK